MALRTGSRSQPYYKRLTPIAGGFTVSDDSGNRVIGEIVAYDDRELNDCVWLQVKTTSPRRNEPGDRIRVSTLVLDADDWESQLDDVIRAFVQVKIALGA